MQYINDLKASLAYTTVVANRDLFRWSLYLQWSLKFHGQSILSQKKSFEKSKQKYKRYIMQLFTSNATLFDKKNIFFFCLWKLKTIYSKVAYLWQFGFFYSGAPTAQNSPELKTHIRDVTQDIPLSTTLWLLLRSV